MKRLSLLLVGLISAYYASAESRSQASVLHTYSVEQVKSENRIKPSFQLRSSVDKSRAKDFNRKSSHAQSTPDFERKVDKLSSKMPKALSTKELREASPRLSSRSHEFSFYDAMSWVLYDADGDGYYSEFEIEFDADTVYSQATVYAKMYLSRNGGPYELYFTTQPFTLYGNSASDSYIVSTVLNYDYPTGDYDVLIDLYEYGYSDVVATISDYEDIDLMSLPLEDREFDSLYGQEFEFYSVETTLNYDEDGDGFYSRFEISFDADTEFNEADVYAEIYFLNASGNWEFEYQTGRFTLYSNEVSDEQVIEFDWISGYQTGYYDFKIVLRDYYSGQLVAEADYDFASLIGLPLESSEFDSQNSGGGSNHGGGSSSSTESGGAVYWLLIGFLAALRCYRIKVS